MAATKAGAAHLTAYQFKPGQSGNPNGTRGPKPNIRKVSAEWCDELKHYLFNDSEAEFIHWLEEEQRSMAEKLTAKLIHKVYLTGDSAAFKILMETLIGKPKELVEVSRGPDAAGPVIADLSDDELQAREARLVDAGV